MPEKEMLQLSPSRISDYQQCPALYKYRAIDKLVERPGLDALRGSLVHLILEKVFINPPTQRDFITAVSLTKNCWEELLKEEPELICALDENIAFPLTESIQISDERLEVLFEEVKTLVANYYSLEDPSKIQPKSTEELIEFDLSENLKIKGYVDRIDESPQGWLRINDYKTGKSPKENFSSKAMFQLKFYALVILKSTKQVPKLLRLIYLKDSQILTYEPNEQELDLTLKKVEAVAAQIQHSKDTNDWPTNITKLCDYCYFKSICPAFTKTKSLAIL
jgi:putative RecB family exonuclease